jgi:hypothetical protein
VKKEGVMLGDELAVGVIVGVGVILGVEVTVGVIVGVGVGLIPQGSPLHKLSVVALTSPSGGPIAKGSQGYVVVEKGEPPTSKNVVIVVPDW